MQASLMRRPQAAGALAQRSAALKPGGCALRVCRPRPLSQPPRVAEFFGNLLNGGAEKAQEKRDAAKEEVGALVAGSARAS